MATKSKSNNRPSADDIAKFMMLYPLLDSLLEEVRDFSKKKPDGVLSKLKVGTINRILKDLKVLLANDPSIIYLDLLDDETLPQNSDATLILGQFKAAMIQYKRKHYGWNGHDHGWETSSGFISERDVEEA
jgi:hypothetical protein